MRQQWSRRGFLGLCGTATTAAALTAAGCSSQRHDDAEIGGPVTVSHLFGETTVPAPPKRVVCAGYTGQDDLLAVGVVPIAVTDWFGDQPFAVWPWAQSRLGDAKPTVLKLDDGIPVRQIAGLKPDLIVATNAGLDADTYAQLAAIAPTLAQAGGDAFFEPWQVQAAAIGTAVHQGAPMQALIDQVQAKFAEVAAGHPGFKDKKALLLSGRLDRGRAVPATGWRTDFLTRMGLTLPESAGPLEPDRLTDADVLIWTTDSDDEQRALREDPALAAVAKRSVFTSTEQAGAITFGSPLSYPLVTQQLPPLIAKITG